MREKKVHDKVFEPFISREEIENSIQRIADEIYEEYKDKTPVFVGVLSGVVMFFTEVMKRYKGDCEITFMQLSSYSGTASTGKIKLIIDLPKDLVGRDIIILEDIVDTGNTLEFLYDYFDKKEGINSIKVASLFLKPDVYSKDLKVDYLGMKIPDHFVLGYGLDYDGIGRNYTELYKLKS